MNEQKPIVSKAADDLTKTTNPGDVHLTEKDLDRVAGGGLAGESTDDKHKDE
jgi:hypothetical protein